MVDNKQNSIAKNSFFNIAYQLFKVLFPLIYSAYVSRVLFASGVGKVSYAQNIVQYFTIVAALGIPNYGIREIAKIRNNNNLTNKLFTELITINSVSTTICVIAYYLFVSLIPYFEAARALYYVVGLNIVFNYINVDWFYQGEEQYSYIAKRSFGIKVLSLIAIFIFIKDNKDFVLYALVFTLALAGNNLFNVFNLRKFHIRLDFNSIDLHRHLKPVFILLCTSFAIEMYTLLDTTMLGLFCSEEVIGYYTNTMKLVKVLIMIISAIGGVLLPRLSFYSVVGNLNKCNELVNKIFTVMLYLFLPCGIGLILVSSDLIPVLFGESFMPAIITLEISALLIYALGFSNLFGTQILLTFDGEKKLLICTVMGALTNIVLNLFLIPRYAQNGAAIASVISESIVTFFTYYFAKKYVRIKPSKKYWMSLLLSVSIMSVCVCFARKVFVNTFSSLAFSMVVGTLVYLTVTCITKNEVLFEFVAIVRRKVKKKV